MSLLLTSTKKWFLVIALLPALWACNNHKNKNSQQTIPQTDKPNFLFIAVDDLNTYNSVLGGSEGVFLEKVYPDSIKRNAVIKKLTPNLDQFAKKALTFNNAYCASPLCGPSRTALLTGVPTHISGYYSHQKHFRHYETLANTITLPQYLKQNGYFTSGIGKVFHKPSVVFEKGYFSDWPDRLFSWTDWVDANAGTGAARDTYTKSTETLSRYYNPKNGIKSYKRFGTTDLPSQFSNDYINAQHIARLMADGFSEQKDLQGENHAITLPRNKPWFLACGIFAPHLPWIAPQDCYDLFPTEEMQINRELITWLEESLKGLSPTGKRLTNNTNFNELRQYGISLDGKNGDINAWKAAFQAYLATTSFSDKCLGVLFDAIKKNPQFNNTVVILWSDHGYHVGDKNRQGKTTLWEASNRCNFMVFDPRFDATSKGTTSFQGVSLQDIYPTVVSLAGLKRPKHIHGYDLSENMKNPITIWKHPVLSTYEEGNHTIRTQQYRYIRFKNGDQELYDLTNDPFEEDNLVNDPELKETIIDMDNLLNQTLHKKPNDY